MSSIVTVDVCVLLVSVQLQYIIYFERSECVQDFKGSLGIRNFHWPANVTCHNDSRLLSVQFISSQSNIERALMKRRV